VLLKYSTPKAQQGARQPSVPPIVTSRYLHHQFDVGRTDRPGHTAAAHQWER
jgi:hypothetical protein